MGTLLKICVFYAATNGIDDVGFVAALLDDLARRTPVDRGRVYATDFSNGAMMAHRLAAERPDLVAAIAPVGGSMVLERAEPKYAAVIPHGLGYHQPFCAAHGPKAREILGAHSGQMYHIHDFANHPDVLHIAEDDVKRVCPTLHCFLNANTPDELREIAAMVDAG